MGILEQVKATIERTNTLESQVEQLSKLYTTEARLKRHIEDAKKGEDFYSLMDRPTRVSILNAKSKQLKGCLDQQFTLLENMQLEANKKKQEISSSLKGIKNYK